MVDCFLELGFLLLFLMLVYFARLATLALTRVALSLLAVLCIVCLSALAVFGLACKSLQTKTPPRLNINKSGAYIVYCYIT